MEQKILIIHSTDRNVERNFWGYFFSVMRNLVQIQRFWKKISPIFTKTILERTYLLDRWIFCM